MEHMPYGTCRTRPPGDRHPGIDTRGPRLGVNFRAMRCADETRLPHLLLPPGRPADQRGPSDERGPSIHLDPARSPKVNGSCATIPLALAAGRPGSAPSPGVCSKITISRQLRDLADASRDPPRWPLAPDMPWCEFPGCPTVWYLLLTQFRPTCRATPSRSSSRSRRCSGVRVRCRFLALVQFVDHFHLHPWCGDVQLQQRVGTRYVAQRQYAEQDVFRADVVVP
jgi:hypothetical protein